MSSAVPPMFDALADNAPCGLLLTTTDGLIRRANTTFCHWLGYATTALVDQRRVQDLLTMGGRVFHQTHWAPLLQIQGSVAEVMLEIVHSDGHTVPMLLNAISQKHNDVNYHSLSFMVVTDRHKYERELLLARRSAETALASRAEAQKALQNSEDQLRHANEQLSIADRKKDEFLATLAHELRNPLAPMRNVIEVLEIKPSADPQVRWAIDIIQRQLHHMTHLVDDLMEVSRITQSKLELRKQPLELTTVMRNAVEAVQAIIESSSHDLSVTFPSEPISLEADPTRLTQVLQNLLNNAAKYTPAGGKIWLSAERHNNEVVISVRDSGIGIPKENLATVFEMFSQLSPALERAQGGLGIGLALVKGLVELHGGTVAAYSNGPGHGSEFIVRLPAHPVAHMPATKPLENVQFNSQRLRILIVDDNEDAAESLAMLLELQGHEVSTTHDGISALQLAETLSPQVVLLDIGLPGINGYEVARRIRQALKDKNTALIAVTGWGQQQDKQNAANAGFDFHLTKPIELMELNRLIALSQWQAGVRS